VSPNSPPALSTTFRVLLTLKVVANAGGELGDTPTQTVHLPTSPSLPTSRSALGDTLAEAFITDGIALTSDPLLVMFTPPPQ